MHATEGNGRPRIFHVSGRENVMQLRDEVLRMHGFVVQSTVYSVKVVDEVLRSDYDLVLIDVEADVRVQGAQELCDEIIRAEFNPEALVRGVQDALKKNDENDKDRMV